MSLSTKEKREGLPPNNGIRTEIYYFDDQDNPVKKSDSTKVMIRELDANGNLIFETFATVGKK
jgi:hypothetical protein